MLKVICPFGGLNRVFVVAIISLTLASCTKDERLPFSDKPEIELIGLSHDTIREYQDALIITIRYFDGNGDLGFEEPEKYALFVRDYRLENFDGFYIGPLAPPDSRVAITGTLDIEFPSLFLFGSRSSETTRFDIKMIDRSGMESNVLTTGNVVIVRP
jgi:hypothetical protein